MDLELLDGATIAHEMTSLPSHKPGITHAWIVSFCKRLQKEFEFGSFHS
jgi:hypothetical protein